MRPDLSNIRRLQRYGRFNSLEDAASAIRDALRSVSPPRGSEGDKPKTRYDERDFDAQGNKE